ncbi:MAG: sulfite exporter TauE/SafE family protein [Hyphomicrobiales bacterium]|nr:sulfite exporter TauE/SafE family protein [Hyphomicrobiales bacterium]
MIGGLPLGEIAFLAALILAGGMVTGLLAGLFGIGGGGIIVPVLYEIFRALDVPEEVRMQLCVGTSLAIIVPTNVRSYRTHRRYGAVLTDVVRAWALPAVVGVATGALIAGLASGKVLTVAFAVITGVIGAKMLIGRDDLRIATELPGRAAMAGYGYLVGLSASMIGVSGGSVSNMILTLHARPIHNAVATSAAVGVPITIAGVAGYMLAGLPQQALMPPLSMGFVSLIGFALMAPVSTLVAPYGARFAHALPRRKLEMAFAVFLLCVSMRFFASLAW